MGYTSSVSPQVYLHTQLEARTVVLPTNGEVIFGEGASISFVDRVSADDERCKEVGKSLKTV